MSTRTLSMEASQIVQNKKKEIDVGNNNNQNNSFRVLQISRPSELGYDGQQKNWLMYFGV